MNTSNSLKNHYKSITKISSMFNPDYQHYDTFVDASHEFNFKMANVKAIGGAINKYRLGKNIYHVNVDQFSGKDDNGDDLHIKFFSFNDTNITCAHLIIFKQKSEAIIQNVINSGDCVLGCEDKINKKKGNVLINIMIDVCRKKGIRRVMLKDNSVFRCSNGKTIKLWMARTMTHGMPYYSKFGFVAMYKGTRKNIEKNYALMKQSKIKDLNIKKYIEQEITQNKKMYVEKKQLIKNMITFIDKEPDRALMPFLKKIMGMDCGLFHNIYTIIYKKLGLNILNDMRFVYDISPTIVTQG